MDHREKDEGEASSCCILSLTAGLRSLQHQSYYSVSPGDEMQQELAWYVVNFLCTHEADHSRCLRRIM
jgi:hypothetical protein